MNGVLRSAVTFILLCSSWINAPGIENTSHLYFGLRTHYGLIIPHSEKIRDISGSNPRGLELDFGWHLTGDKTWQHCFCYPRAGVMFSMFNFGNPEILGNSYILTPYFEPFMSAHRDVSLSFKTGIGLAYLDNIHDPVTNPENLFYCTRLSFLVFLNLAVNYRLKENISLKISGYYNHISNGGNRQPNYGINFPTASIGFDYFFSAPHFPFRSPEDYRPEEKSASAVRLSVFFTAKEMGEDKEKLYPVIGLSPKYSYLIGRLSAVTAGFEFVSDNLLRKRIKQESPAGTDHKRFSMSAGHELLIGRFNFYQELGVYLYSPYKAKEPVYQRYGLEYFIRRNLSAGANIKAHRHDADFLDWRISYSF